MRVRYSIPSKHRIVKIFTSILVIVGVILSIAVVHGIRPRSEMCPGGLDYEAHYHGLGLFNTSNILGRVYTSVSMSFGDIYGEMRLAINKKYHPFILYYPDKKVMAEGRCGVYMVGDNNIPVPDLYNIYEGVSYDVFGNVVSEVHSGKGSITYFSASGVLQEIIEFRDGEMTLHKKWHANGNVSSFAEFKNGVLHGKYITYHHDGTVNTHLMYINGMIVTVEEPEGSATDGRRSTTVRDKR